LTQLLRSATDIFAFQGSQIRSTPRSSVPEVITSWPSLLPDPLAASISSPSQSRTQPNSSGTAADDIDNSNVNSILAVADNAGCIYYFLDGSYPLGATSLGPEISIPSLSKDPKLSLFYVHPRKFVEETSITDLQPAAIDVPLLDKRDARAMANLSSTARELLWYTMRVVKEMRHVWFGSETHTGARELGPKWIRALETKQKDQFGRVYTTLLVEALCQYPLIF